ncbi:MAG: hypothetical protein VB050_04925 [Geobacteraceae bacterium]|nr:hypothetical protein [Geobacteraceae bacterium]
MKAEELAKALGRYTSAPNGFMACCPAHDDKNPSLSIKDSVDGKILVHCHAGCSQDKVVTVLKAKGLWPTESPTKRVKQIVTGKYEYFDHHGNLLYWKERVEPGKVGRSKEFRFYHNDHEGKRQKGRGSSAALYRKGEVSNANTVIIVEGEKQADLISSWGLTATTLDSGASSPWREDYLTDLSGKQIVILPDNDKPGRKYATMIAEALYGKVESLHVVELPGLSDKGDICDWVKTSGNDKGKLLEIIEATQEWGQQGPPDEKVNFVQIESERPGWPKLSKTPMPEGLVADFVNLACEHSEADPAAVLTTFLVRFGIECGCSPHMMVGETRHTTRLNAVIVGDSSKARKGTSAGPVKSLFASIGEGCRVSPGPLSSGEGIIFAVRDEQTEWKINKGTCDGEWVVSDPGVDDKRLFVLDEEFANALNATKREGNTLSSILRCLFDDGNAEPLTKSNRTKATGAHVGIVTHITLFELKKRLTENEQLNGFGNRFLWVCAKRNGIVPFPEPMNQTRLLALRELMEQRLMAAKSCSRLEFTDEAKQLWAIEYPRLSMAHTGLSGCMVNRGEALVIRLSLVYALLAGHTSIERRDLEAAIALWNYCYESVVYIFGGSAADGRKNRIMEAIGKSECGKLSKSGIRKDVFSNHVNAEVLTEILADMEKEGMIELEIDNSTGGAPKTIVKIKSSCVKSAISAISSASRDENGVKTLKTQNAGDNSLTNDAPFPM